MRPAALAVLLPLLVLAASAEAESLVVGPPVPAGRWLDSPVWRDGGLEVARYREEDASGRQVGLRRITCALESGGEAAACELGRESETGDGLAPEVRARLATADAALLDVQWARTEDSPARRWDRASGRLVAQGPDHPTRRARLMASAHLVFGDLAPLLLRALGATDEGRFVLDLVEPDGAGAAGPPRVRARAAEVHGTTNLVLPAGIAPSVRVTLTRGGVEETLYFLREPPHALVRWDRADGGRWLLVSLGRRASGAPVDGEPAQSPARSTEPRSR